MTDPFEVLLRSTLSDMAEEAPTVQDALSKAERQVRHRRLTTVALSTAGVAVALMIGAPLAFADGGKGDPPASPVQPAQIAPSTVPSTSGPSGIFLLRSAEASPGSPSGFFLIPSAEASPGSPSGTATSPDVPGASHAVPGASSPAGIFPLTDVPGGPSAVPSPTGR